MGDAMVAAGVGPEVRYKDQLYRFQPIRVYEIAKYERWLEREHFESAYRQEAWLPKAKFDALLEATRADVTGQKCRFGGRIYNESMLSLNGMKQIALISLQAVADNPPDVDGELVQALFDNKPQEMLAVMVGIGWLKREPPPQANADAPQ